MSTSENGQRWREELLVGVETIPKLGTPGQIVVFDEEAEAILTGSTHKDVLVAVAELGRGRVVAITHNGYLGNGFPGQIENQQINQLLSNVKKWVTRDSNTRPEDIELVHKAENTGGLEQYKAVYYSGKAPNDETKVLEYVKNGGGLIHAMTPWGWLQINPGKTLEDMPLWEVLFQAGICYNARYIRCNGDSFMTGDNQADQSNLVQSLNGFFLDGESPETFLAGVEVAPPTVVEVIRDRFSGYLTPSHMEGFIPSKANPISNADSKAMLKLWEFLNFPSPAPGFELFPGGFEVDPPMVTVETEIHTIEGVSDKHNTGFYAVAGQPVKVEVMGTPPEERWAVRIGAHTDNLTGQAQLKRWPKITIQSDIKGQALTLTSAFGGLLYLINFDKQPSTLRLKLHNVVEAPYFQLSDRKSVSDWSRRRMAPGLWADIEGRYITLTLPSSSVRDIEDPTPAMRLWDKIVELYHELRGTDIEKHRHEFIVTDLQPSAGYMHSGYPIVTQLDVADPNNVHFLLNYSRLSNGGSWAPFHEIGHNMQIGSAWTYEGTVQVTCNIFALYAMEMVSGVAPWIHYWLKPGIDKAKKLAASDSGFDDWKRDARLALFIYAQIIHYFGWDLYKRVFREYEAMDDSTKPTGRQQKIDEWWARVSIAAGHNLTPLLKVWGLPFTESGFTSRVQHLPVFYPDDEITPRALFDDE